MADACTSRRIISPSPSCRTHGFLLRARAPQTQAPRTYASHSKAFLLWREPSTGNTHLQPASTFASSLPASSVRARLLLALSDILSNGDTLPKFPVCAVRAALWWLQHDPSCRQASMLTTCRCANVTSCSHIRCACCCGAARATFTLWVGRFLSALRVCGVAGSVVVARTPYLARIHVPCLSCGPATRHPGL